MRVRCAAALVLLVLAAQGMRALADDDLPMTVPDEMATRKQVTDLIASFTDAKKPATLGMLQQAVDLSISFGAPAYNQGDHAGCYRFYATTARGLVAAFGKPENATEAARPKVADLRTALQRAAGAPNPDKAAWEMRYAFDKIALASELKSADAEHLVDIGMECLKRGQAADAQDAFASATDDLKDLEGEALDKISPAARFAPLALANALFAQKKYVEAAAAVQHGLTVLPEWPDAKHDLRSDFSDPEGYEAVMDDLTQQSAADPKNAALHYLLGYHDFFTGKLSGARLHFEKAQELAPDMPGVKPFIERLKKGETDAPDQATHERA